MDFLPGALPFSAKLPPEPELAADVVWFDSLVLNVDRTPRNPNLLRWHGRLWLIDHGAALYVHHGGGDPVARAGERFPAIRDHVLLPFAGLDRGGRRAPGAAAGPRAGGGDRRRAARPSGAPPRPTAATSRPGWTAPRGWAEEADEPAR